MGNNEPYVVEAEYVTKEQGPPRQSGKELFERLLMQPEPLASIRLTVIDPGLILRMEACAEAERRRDQFRAKLHATEQTGSTDRPHRRESAKVVAKRLAELGAAAREARRHACSAFDYALQLAAAEHGEILIRNEGCYLPLDAMETLVLLNEVCGLEPSTLILYHSGSARAPSREGLLMLA